MFSTTGFEIEPLSSRACAPPQLLLIGVELYPRSRQQSTEPPWGPSTPTDLMRSRLSRHAGGPSHSSGTWSLSRSSDVPEAMSHSSGTAF
jgi:hypothetical protein